MSQPPRTITAQLLMHGAGVAISAVGVAVYLWLGWKSR